MCIHYFNDLLKKGCQSSVFLNALLIYLAETTDKRRNYFQSLVEYDSYGGNSKLLNTDDIRVSNSTLIISKSFLIYLAEEYFNEEVVSLIYSNYTNVFTSVKYNSLMNEYEYEVNTKSKAYTVYKSKLFNYLQTYEINLFKLLKKDYDMSLKQKGKVYVGNSKIDDYNPDKYFNFETQQTTAQVKKSANPICKWPKNVSHTGNSWAVESNIIYNHTV